jgi:hypothetical protein
MLRIGLLLVLITGIFVCFKIIKKRENSPYTYYKITPIKAASLNPDKVRMSDDYYLMLQFDRNFENHKKNPLGLKKKTAILKCSNQIEDIKIFSTEKVNEIHPAGKDLSALFDFHYIRNMETKYGTMIKEGIIIPLSEFENLVDQDNPGNQLNELKLRLTQKPIMQSEHQFIINVYFKNGETWCDTTECISFDGVN